MKILLLGPQGCGKGTIGQMLSEKIGIPILSVGEMLRSVDESSPYYQQIKEETQRGVLVDEKIVASLLKEELSKDKYKNGFILDGWARSMENLRAFDPGFDLVIVFELSRETSIKRISGRRICEEDGKVYNIYTLPKEELEKCKGRLIQREDDTEEAVKTRLEIYYTQTKQVVDYFDSLGKTIHIDAEPLPDVVFSNLMAQLNL